MSILIKGMEMPTECEYCAMCRYYPENGSVWCNAKGEVLKRQWKDANWTYLDVKRPDWCPLIEVPTPHGRLIDADKVIETHKVGNWDLHKVLAQAKTIVEAEE